MNIKEKRTEKGLSQQQLADKTGIPKDRIGKWEQGKGKPKTDDYKVLEEFFMNYTGKEEVPHETSNNLNEDQAAYTKGSFQATDISSLIQTGLIHAKNYERLIALIENKYAPGNVEGKLDLDKPGTKGTVTTIPETTNTTT